MKGLLRRTSGPIPAILTILIVQFGLWPLLRSFVAGGVYLEVAMGLVSMALLIRMLRETLSREAGASAFVPVAGVFAGLVVVAAQILAMFPVFEEYVPDPYIPPDVAGIRFEGGTVFVDGVITLAMFSRLETEISSGFVFDMVVLSSPGGNVFAARGLARLVLEAGADTVASGPCLSACPLVFMAGTSRRLEAGKGVLGFHSYGDAGNADVGQMPLRDISRQQDRDRAWFISRGVSKPFAEKAFSVPHDQMWHPSTDELETGGVVTMTD